MKFNGEKKEHALLYHLHHLPKRIMSLHESTYCIPDFVLYDLCHEDCFNFSKAAYFVDNPDFDHLQGIVGINRDDHSFCQHDHWESPDDFCQTMKKSEFNNKVRTMQRKSMKRHGEQEQAVVRDIASTLQLKHPHYYCWKMKHDNHGLLVTESDEKEKIWYDDYLKNSLYFLNFCPF